MVEYGREILLEILPKKELEENSMENIHPMLIHFPIALFSVGFFVDFVGSLLWVKDSLKQAGYWMHAMGLLLTVPAIVSGVVAENTLDLTQELHSLVKTHEQFGFLSLGLFGGLFFWRWRAKMLLDKRTWKMGLYLSLSAVALLVLLYGASLGGDLVYDHGLGTRLR